jgi:hypothetical protein
MRARCLLVLAVVWAVACASTTTASPTLTTFQHLRLLQTSDFISADWRPDGSAHAPALRALERWAEAQRITVSYAALGHKTYMGHAQQSELLGWVVLIDRDLGADAQLYALAHELGHVYSPPLRIVEEREVFAELVAVQVCAAVDLDVSRETALYLAARTTADDQERVIRARSADIDRVVQTLRAGMLGHS